MWYISHPAKWGPLISHFSRLPSEVGTNAPLRVPTNNRTPLIDVPLLPTLNRAFWKLLSRNTECRGTPLLAAHHPGDAESVDQHTKAASPECLLNRHHDFAAFTQCFKLALRLRRLPETDRNREPSRLREIRRRSISAHKNSIADLQCRVHYFLAPLGRNTVLHRTALVTEHGLQFATQGLLVKLESFFTIAVETQIGSKLHGLLLRSVDSFHEIDV